MKLTGKADRERFNSSHEPKKSAAYLRTKQKAHFQRTSQRRLFPQRCECKRAKVEPNENRSNRRLGTIQRQATHRPQLLIFKLPRIFDENSRGAGTIAWASFFCAYSGRPQNLPKSRPRTWTLNHDPPLSFFSFDLFRAPRVLLHGQHHPRLTCSPAGSARRMERIASGDRYADSVGQANGHR